MYLKWGNPYFMIFKSENDKKLQIVLYILKWKTQIQSNQPDIIRFLCNISYHHRCCNIFYEPLIDKLRIFIISGCMYIISHREIKQQCVCPRLLHRTYDTDHNMASSSCINCHYGEITPKQVTKNHKTSGLPFKNAPNVVATEKSHLNR